MTADAFQLCGDCNVRLPCPEMASAAKFGLIRAPAICAGDVMPDTAAPKKWDQTELRLVRIHVQDARGLGRSLRSRRRRAFLRRCCWAPRRRISGAVEHLYVQVSRTQKTQTPTPTRPKTAPPVAINGHL